jgi:Domain of unknown function (DUF222)
LRSFERRPFQFETSCCKVTTMDAYPSDAERAERMRSIETLKNEITRLAGHLNAANHRFLMLIAEFDRREGWSDGATQSCAHWLNWKCGISIVTAREKVRVARALESLPKISAAMARGELSYWKVRELTRVACEGTEEYLLSIALHGTADHVEQTVRGFRRAKDAEELSKEAQQQANRSVHYQYEEDGSLILRARLPAEVGALVLKALQSAMDQAPQPDAPAGASEQPPSWAARRADAMGVLAESFLEHGPGALNGGDRHLVTVHVAAETLRHKEAGCCEFEEGPSIAAETARRLACDTSVVAIIENEDGEPLNVGRKTRTISSPLRRFLNARDRGCRFPGCSNTRWCDAHHIKHWANGGETKPLNLVSLCRFHHRMVHEGRVEIHVLDDGALRFIQPNGQALDSVAPDHLRSFADWTQLPAAHNKQGIHIDENTAATRWAGESMDYGLAVQVLLHQARRARNVAAGTPVMQPDLPGKQSAIQSGGPVTMQWVSDKSRAQDFHELSAATERRVRPDAKNSPSVTLTPWPECLC